MVALKENQPMMIFTIGRAEGKNGINTPNWIITGQTSILSGIPRA
jgi:hypothetical protein